MFLTKFIPRLEQYTNIVVIIVIVIHIHYYDYHSHWRIRTKCTNDLRMDFKSIAVKQLVVVRVDEDLKPNTYLNWFFSDLDEFGIQSDIDAF